MNKRINIFPRLEIETQSTCNRTCPTCIRNSIPDRESVSSWFEKNQLPIETIEKIFVESTKIGFRGEVCLSHYNEPLMDERIIEIAKMARKFQFSRVFMCSNGDFLTENLANELDNLMDDIGFTLYMNEPTRSKRDMWIRTLFKRSKIKIAHYTDGEHDRMITHNSPLVDASSLAKKFSNNPCHHPQKRMIINHRGQMLLCCDDLVGNFDLGSIHESSIEELWYSEKHQDHVISLMNYGGRKINQHCLTCPRQS